MEHIVEMAGVVLNVSGIETFPKGAVRECVIRCADCEHSRIEEHTGDKKLTCWVFEKFGLVVKPTHHCGYGVLKKDCQNTAKNEGWKKAVDYKPPSRPEHEFTVLSDGPYAENK